MVGGHAVRSRYAEALIGLTRQTPVLTPPGRSLTVGTDEVEKIEVKIAELKARWPAHSVPPQMWEELEELESRLGEAKRVAPEETDGGQTGGHRL